MKRMPIFVLIILSAITAVRAQQQPAAPPVVYDPNTSLFYDVARIAAAVDTMTKTFKEFVDKFAKVDGISLTEKQQRLITGMQVLVQAEQRAATQQKYHIELVEKESQLRARLAQVEAELNPQAIDRSVALEGSTQTPEIKEGRRRTLQSERTSLLAVLQQLQISVQEASRDTREAHALVNRLRRTFLPVVERELSEQ